MESTKAFDLGRKHWFSEYLLPKEDSKTKTVETWSKNFVERPTPKDYKKLLDKRLAYSAQAVNTTCNPSFPCSNNNGSNQNLTGHEFKKQTGTLSDLHDTCSDLSDVSGTLCANPYKKLERIEVSNVAIFSCVTNDKALAAQIRIINRSPNYVTYRVMSSSPCKFDVQKKIGWIEPEGVEDLMVLVARAKKHGRRTRYYQFHEIMNEGFTIFALPVFYRTQIDDAKLKVLWRAFGTTMFPTKVAEAHRLTILPSQEEYLSRLSVLQIVSRWFPRTNILDVKHDMDPVTEDVFYASWPTDDESYDKVANLQLEGWNSMLKTAKKVSEDATKSIRMMIAIILTGMLTFFAMYIVV